MSASSHPAKVTVEEYNSFVLRHTWRNIWLNAADGILYAMGLALAHPNTVLPGFISDCVARVPLLEPHKNALVGFLGLVTSICFMMPQQLWAARITEGRTVLKPLLILVAFFERLPWLAMGIMTALVASRNPQLALYLFFAIIFSYQFILGIVSPVWQEAVAKMTPVNKRGLLFGVRESIGGVMGVLTLIVAQRFVGGASFPENYVFLFLGMFLCTTISWTALFFLKEAPYPFERKARPLAAYFADIKDVVLHDRAFVRYFWCRSFFSLAAVASQSFFGMRAIKVLDAAGTLQLMVNMTLVVTLARTVSVFVGPIGDRYGHRLLLALGNVATALGIAVALFASSAWGFYAAYAVATFGMMAFWCGHSNFILELAPLEKRPSYISLDNMAGLPFVWAPFLGGWLADAFGYTVPFVIGIALSLAGAVGFLTVVADPRKGMRKDMVS